MPDNHIRTLRLGREWPYGKVGRCNLGDFAENGESLLGSSNALNVLPLLAARRRDCLAIAQLRQPSMNNCKSSVSAVSTRLWYNAHSACAFEKAAVTLACNCSKAFICAVMLA